MSNETNKPIAKIRCKDIILAVWENENGSRSLTLERIYKPKDGTWKSTSSFGVDDFPKIRHVLDKAEEELISTSVEVVEGFQL